MAGDWAVTGHNPYARQATLKRNNADMIARCLAEADASIKRGLTVTTVCKQLGISRATLYRWKRRFTGLGVSDMQRLLEFEVEIAELKATVSDLQIEIRVLREVLRGNA